MLKLPTFFKKNNHGFTLVEILVAISILAIISVVAIPNLRNFNDTQALQNTSNDLARVIREAQSGANSRIKCSSNFISKKWYVRIDNSSQKYLLRNECYDLATGSVQTDTLYESNPKTTKDVVFASRSKDGGCGTADVVFGSEYQPYAHDRFSNISFECSPGNDDELEINLSLGTAHLYICLEKGGAINAQSTACF